MTFDERKIRAILAVADSGSLGRAAEIVHMTQPALSRCVQQVEAALRIEIFERHSKGMTPTAAGEILIERARVIGAEFEGMRENADDINNLRRGKVRLGAVAAASCRIVPLALQTFMADAPEVAIELFEAPDGELAQALVERRIDIAVATDGLRTPGIVSPGACGGTDRFVICGRPQATDGPPLTLSIEELLSRSWVMLAAGRTPRKMFDDLVKSIGHVPPTAVVETNSINAQVAMVENTDLLAWLPITNVRDKLEDGRLIIYGADDLTMDRQFSIYLRDRGVVSHPSRRLIEILTTELGLGVVG